MWTIVSHSPLNISETIRDLIEAWFQRTTDRKLRMGIKWRPTTSCDPERCCEAVRSAVQLGFLSYLCHQWPWRFVFWHFNITQTSRKEKRQKRALLIPDLSTDEVTTSDGTRLCCMSGETRGEMSVSLRMPRSVGDNQLLPALSDDPVPVADLAAVVGEPLQVPVASNTSNEMMHARHRRPSRILVRFIIITSIVNQQTVTTCVTGLLRSIHDANNNPVNW